MKAIHAVCAVVVLAALQPLVGCIGGGNKLLLELQGTVMFERPRIESVSHTMLDSRAQGGAAVVRIRVVGDPGLTGSFDISPGIAVAQPLSETSDGSYAGEFSFPTATVGGPFTIVGRLRHEAAGEVVLRDPEPLIIPLRRR